MKRFMLILVVVQFSILGMPSVISPDEGPSGLFGSVCEVHSGRAVEFAAIVLYRLSDSSIVGGCITDTNGRFVLPVENGRYRLLIRFVGYKPFETLVDVKNGSSNLGVIQLEAETAQIEGVEVVSEKTSLEFKTDKQVINASSIISAANGSAIDVLKHSPSISVDNEDNVSLRGSSSFLLLIDDRMVAGNPSDILKQIPASQVESIEIMTNPSARFDAAGASGIINIKSRKQTGSKPSGMINARVGQKEKYLGDAIFKSRYGKLSSQISANLNCQIHHTSSSNELTTFGNNSILTSDVARTRKRFSANIRHEIEYPITERTGLTAGLSWMCFNFKSFIHSDYLRDGELQPQFYYAEDEFLLAARQYQGDVRLQHRFSKPGRQIVFSISGLKWIGINDQDIIQLKSNREGEMLGLQLNRRYYEDHFMDQWDAKAEYKHPLRKGFVLETGLQSNGRYFACDKNMRNIDTLTLTWNQDTRYSGAHSMSETTQAAWLQASGTLSDWGIQAGLRTQFYNRITNIPSEGFLLNFQKLYYFPSIHISHKRENNNQWQLSFSRRINLPNDWITSPVPYYNDGFIMQTGNPALEPELFDVAEVNHIRFIKQQMISLSVYMRKTNNAIERVLSRAANGQYVVSHANLADKFYYGSEVGSSLKLGQKTTLSVFGNVFSLNAFVDDEVQKYSYRQFSYSTRFALQIKPLKSLSCELSGSYHGAERESHGKREPLYSVNLGARYTLMDNKLSFSLSANDIFRTHVYRYTEINDNFKSKLEFRGESPIIFLGLSYRFNNFKPSPVHAHDNSPAQIP